MTAPGLEVDADLAGMVAEAVREQPGREHGDDAEAVGGDDAHGDQAEHVEVHGAERLPAAHQERPAAPEDHRRREDQLRPAGGPLADPGPDRQAEHRPHGDDERAARSAPRRPRSGGGSRRARGSGLPRRSAPPSAPAPCRRSGSRRGRPARSRGASGRCRWCPPASARARAVPRGSSRAPPRTSPGSGRSRSRTARRRASPCAWPSRGRPSCRRPGRSPRRTRRAPPRTARGSPRSRSGRCGRRARAAACRRTDRRSCRRPGRGTVSIVSSDASMSASKSGPDTPYAPSSNWKVKGGRRPAAAAQPEEART